MTTTDQDEQEYFNERAAIYEFDAGFSRNKSEYLAKQDLFFYKREKAKNNERTTR